MILPIWVVCVSIAIVVVVSKGWSFVLLEKLDCPSSVSLIAGSEGHLST